MSSGKRDGEEDEEVQIVDPQLKVFMKSINGQFARFQNFAAGIREELQEIKASQSASAPRVDMHTPTPNLHWGDDDEYHGDTYSFGGGRFHPIRGGRGRGGSGRGIPM
jgi:hypothetical protein